MATAQDLINRASTLASVRPADYALTADLNTLYLDLLNDMLQEWENDGINLGLPTLAASDTITLPDSDLMAIRYNLAVGIAEHSDKDVKQSVFVRATRFLKRLRAKYAPLVDATMPLSLQSRVSYDINTDS